jgi:hypothetical protein
MLLRDEEQHQLEVMRLIANDSLNEALAAMANCPAKVNGSWVSSISLSASLVAKTSSQARAPATAASVSAIRAIAGPATWPVHRMIAEGLPRDARPRVRPLTSAELG